MDEIQYQFDLLKAKNQKLESDAKMYQALVATSTNAFLYYSFEHDKLETMGSWHHFFDFDVHDRKEFELISDAVCEQYRGELRDVLYLEKQQEEYASCDVALDGRKMWVECEVTVSYLESGKPSDKIIRFRDITKFKQQNDELAYLAYYDSLTGLYNRNYFVQVLSEWLHRAKEDHSVVAVMFVDIDDFRKINDGMGLIVGDELVQVFGQFLGELRQDKVIISHFNSDIYCIAIYDPYGSRTVEAIDKKIRTRLESPLRLTNKMDIPITVSIGVAEYPEAAKTALELINCAEIVMFKAKKKKKNAIQYFDAPILNEFLKNIEIENNLKEALFEQQFTLNYQPQYDTKTGKLRGVEALIRWKNRDGNMVSPGEFIPVAERNGSIVPIGKWVIEEAIRSLSTMRRKFQIDFIMSINISAIQYKRAEFVEDLIAIINRYNIDTADVELEITESVFIDDFKDIMGKMYALRDYGFKVSLDDFGTGFSSLSYLKGLPIDTLKIDKSFIDTVIYDESTRIITESIIQMVKKLGFETIAEGVEKPEQFEYLKKIECDNIQGFLLGKPMNQQALEELLSKLVR